MENREHFSTDIAGGARHCNLVAHQLNSRCSPGDVGKSEWRPTGLLSSRGETSRPEAKVKRLSRFFSKSIPA
jgi:hypothetical protein